ncbi:MAG: alpha/beta hydrolase [Dehalococcoidia bacterium]|nr:alpha/beta hydrolase [Dehalococcoidia bacterium]
MLRSQPIAEGHQSVEEIRAGFEQTGAAFPAPPDVAIEKVSANGVPAEWLTPPSAGEGVLLYLHGGGYVIGSINTHRGLVATIAKAASVRALIIDYRLAPEHPFPAAVDDATAAYRFVLASGISPSRIVIGGDSAGGGLTIATLDGLTGARTTVLETRYTNSDFPAELDRIYKVTRFVRESLRYLSDPSAIQNLVTVGGARWVQEIIEEMHARAAHGSPDSVQFGGRG